MDVGHFETVARMSRISFRFSCERSLPPITFLYPSFDQPAYLGRNQRADISDCHDDSDSGPDEDHPKKKGKIESTSGRTLTYHQLLKAVRRCSRGLARLGFEKGDILCMFTPNILEYPIVFYAVASLGGTFQATNPLYNARELQHTLDICKSKFLVTVPALLPTVRHAQSKPKIIVIGGVENGTNFSSLVAEDISTEPVIDADIDAKNDVAGIVFSSGTTGKPKAVQHTHYSLVALTLQLMTTGNMKSSDNCVAFLPFFHVYGLGVVLNTNLYCGGQCVIMSRFEPKEFLKNVTKYKLTSLYLVPPVMVLLSKLPITRRYDLSSVKRIVCGAAPLSMDVEAKIKELFKIPFVTQDR